VSNSKAKHRDLLLTVMDTHTHTYEYMYILVYKTYPLDIPGFSVLRS